MSEVLPPGGSAQQCLLDIKWMMQIAAVFPDVEIVSTALTQLSWSYFVGAHLLV